MKRSLASAGGAVLVFVLVSIAWPQSFGRSADIRRPFDRVRASMLNYFSPAGMHDFQIVSQSSTKSRAEIVARRTVRDKLEWPELAYCKLPGMQMMYTLQQGNVTVRVKMDRESANRTYVSVIPQFEGVYQFAGNQTTLKCTSQGALEKDILSAAGASAADLN